MRRLTLLLVTLSIVVAACSDDDPAAPTTAATSSTTTTTLPTTTAAPSTTTTEAPEDTVAPTTTTVTVTSTTAAPVTTTAAPPPTTTTAPIPLGDVTLALTRVATGFEQPVFVDAPPGDDRIFVVDQIGLIHIARAGQVFPEPFLDVRDSVRFGGERGLLGLAFHPRYATNGRFYIHYSTSGGNRIEEIRTTDDPDIADLATRRTIFGVSQPASNHNGGMIAFGPDGYLYIGLGDGGAADDAFENGQNTDTVLGGILRIDVDGEGRYSIPPGNPFADGGGAPELWAYGLRNPWRFSFDGDLLFIGDVGQNRFEEIDVIDVTSTGANFGWPITEASTCFRPGCSMDGLVLPVYEYGREGGNCSVTGGYVYRGQAIPELQGTYFFGDFCSGTITGFRLDGEGVFEVRRWSDTIGTIDFISSFGTDGFGEIYIASFDGSIYRIDRG